LKLLRNHPLSKVMSLFYRLAYQVGFAPWERAAQTHGHMIAALLDRERKTCGAKSLALEIGCGSGIWSVELAKRGWQVVGIDNVRRAIEGARKRAKAAGVDIRFVEGDVTTLRHTGVGDGFQFFLDLGCIHGLNNKQRMAVGSEVNAVAAPDAVLLTLVWTPAHRGPLPRGASPADLESAFHGWKIVDEDPLDAAALPGLLKNVDPRCYRLRRAS
jgi:SAM-dependent methyltransferase